MYLFFQVKIMIAVLIFGLIVCLKNGIYCKTVTAKFISRSDGNKEHLIPTDISGKGKDEWVGVGVGTDQKSDFAHIQKHNTAFIDKTQDIKNLLDCGRILLTAPPNFGKSATLSMLKYFLEIEVSNTTGDPVTKSDIRKEAVTDTDNYKSFQDLAINRQHPNFTKQYFGKYPVILLDFSKKTNINSYEDAFSQCTAAIREAYRQHCGYLMKSSKLHDNQKEECRKWCYDTEYSNTSTINNFGITDAVPKLTRYLKKHFGRNSVILVDEYDAFYRGALGCPDEATFRRCIGLYEEITECAFLDRGLGAHTAFGILTGISYSLLYNVKHLRSFQVHSFLQYIQEASHQFYDLHGFAEQEFHSLMDAHNIPDDLREQATRYYNGYSSQYGEIRLYNPSSVVHFLSTKVVENYWPKHTEFFNKLQYLSYENYELLVKRLLFGKNCEITFYRLKYSSLAEEFHLHRLYSFPAFLYEQGYLKIVRYLHIDTSTSFEYNENLNVEVALANEQMRLALIDELRKFYRTCGKFDWKSMAACSKHLDNIVFEDSAICTKNIGEFYTSMEIYCDAFFANYRKEVENGTRTGYMSEYGGKQYLCRLIYNIASLTKYTVKIDDSIFGISADIIMYSDQGCIIIQLKYNRTAQDALNDLNGQKFLNETAKCVLIGINLSEEKQLSMSATISKIGINRRMDFPNLEENKQSFAIKIKTSWREKLHRIMPSFLSEF